MTFIWIALVIWLSTCSSLSHAISVTFSAPTECGYMNISWTGGYAPFAINFISIYGRQLVQSVPSSAYQDGKGFYQTQLPYSSGTQFLFLLQDASGFPAGGTSSLLSVGPNSGNQKCNTATVLPDFEFGTAAAVLQCQSFLFYDYNNGTMQPVTIMGILPGKQVFTLSPPTGSTMFNWVADLPSIQSTVLFTMVDAAGHKGGVTQLLTVEDTGNSSCLDSSFPSPNPIPPAQVATSLPSTSSMPSSTGSSTSSAVNARHLSGAALAGIIVACCLTGIAVITSAIFIPMRLRRKRARRREAPILDLAEDVPPQGHVITSFPHPISEYTSSSFVPDSLHNNSRHGSMTNLSMPCGMYPTYHPLSNASEMAEVHLDPFEPPDYDTVTMSPNGSSGGGSSTSRTRLYRVANQDCNPYNVADEKAAMSGRAERGPGE
ncbi:hypothetical protein NEOLEDRAFT_906689 [Neolentinus lepideus HHB14362 ss-1]|uniref:Mid2 domain-containing protein n=1 Tax=Neolentinus lepideus HHB14362 ss-1 TaxID=1314782 RepID=A0A165UJ38_9AGAM|nr:hypothetical protein NEOLEDRAFT_906689 [Neolentinus lepideus HHB14362 ss-1]